LVHNKFLGDNQISGGQDFAVPLNIASIGAYIKTRYVGKIELSIFKYPDDLIDAVKSEPPDILGFSN